MEITKFELQHGLNYKHRKENNFTDEYVLINLDSVDNKYGQRIIVTMRLYYTAKMCYCCLWIHRDTGEASGSGGVDGGGYHKGSAAFYRALKSAGIEVDEGIAGVGDSCYYKILPLIGEKLGFNNTFVHHSHA